MEGNSVLLEYLGAPPGGGVSAVAIAGKRAPISFAGTAIGLYRSGFSAGELPLQWEYLVQAPLGILALAASPQYDTDHLILVGTTTGLYYSQDDGETWSSAKLPQASSTILCFAFSPQFEQDGIILAGTLEDGVLFSDDGGKTWSLRSFGLLDAAVYCLSLSPNFANDGIVFAGTQTALYYSYNHARAWRMLDFPEDAAPIISLAVSPSFATDGIVLAGTEAMGIFRSRDRGESWHRLPLDVCSISAIGYPSTDRLLIASEGGVFFSNDQGENWTISSNLADGLCLAYRDHLWLAGTSDRGLWAKREEEDWLPLTSLAARAFVGMTLSPQFTTHQTLFFYGPQEGIWKTSDGGKSWHCLNEGLPSSEVLSLASAITTEDGFILAAGTSAGCWISRDGGNSWQSTASEPARLVALSERGRWLAAAMDRNGIAFSHDLGKTWQHLSGDWDHGGEILALQIKEDGTFYVAWLESTGQSLSLWQGRADRMQPVLRLPAGEKPVVSLYIPPEGDTWFAAVGCQVWQLPEKTMCTLAKETTEERIIGLIGGHQAKTWMIASTGDRLYYSPDRKNWQVMANYQPDRAISISVKREEGEIEEVFILLLGGKAGRIKI